MTERLQSYLSDRLNNEESDKHFVKYGIPQ